MSVKTSFSVDESQLNGMNLTISITMKLSEWRAFREKITREGYEAHNVDDAIRDCLGFFL